MRTFFVALVLTGTVAVTCDHALAQQTPPYPAPGAAPKGQQTPPPAQQTPPPPPRAGQPPPAPSPVVPIGAPPPGQNRATTPKPAWDAPGRTLQNVKLDLTITDTFGTTTKKTVTMLIADTFAGRIRSSNDVPVGNAFRAITINIDAIPEIRANGSILLTLTVEYVPDLSTMSQTGGAPKPANINESLTVLVADGKPTVISQSADPATERRVTVEVTASIVK